MALSGNKGDWSEPYALFKLLIDGKLFLGGENYSQIEGIFYPILKIIRHEKNRQVHFTKEDELVIISDEEVLYKIPIYDFIEKAGLCLSKIKSNKNKDGSFSIPEIEDFLSTFSIKTLKAKAKLKNDITIQVEDPKTFISPMLGFSIKSQLGSPSTLLNASNATNFTYRIIGKVLEIDEIELINNKKHFSDKFKIIKSLGAELEFEKVDNDIFKSNLQTIDYHFDKIISEILILFYENEITSENTIAKFIEKLTVKNSRDYDLNINSSIYEMIMKKFLTDYALGMRAAEVWKRDYQATGGYLIVREDGELISYHFYFAKSFEDYLFKNTQLETPSTSRHGFGNIYFEDCIQKMKLNLQIRFIK